jgi:hypothetical protein
LKLASAAPPPEGDPVDAEGEPDVLGLDEADSPPGPPPLPPPPPSPLPDEALCEGDDPPGEELALSLGDGPAVDGEAVDTAAAVSAHALSEKGLR